MSFLWPLLFGPGAGDHRTVKIINNSSSNNDVVDDMANVVNVVNVVNNGGFDVDDDDIWAQNFFPATVFITGHVISLIRVLNHAVPLNHV